MLLVCQIVGANCCTKKKPERTFLRRTKYVSHNKTYPSMASSIVSGRISDKLDKVHKLLSRALENVALPVCFWFLLLLLFVFVPDSWSPMF